MKFNNERLFFSLQSEKESERGKVPSAAVSQARERIRTGFCRSRRGIGVTPLLLCSTLPWRTAAHLKSDSSGCRHAHLFSAAPWGTEPQIPQRGVSPSQHGPHTHMGSVTGPQAHRKVGLTKMSLSLSLSEPISTFPSPAQQHLPAHPSSPLTVSVRPKTR